MPYPVQRPAMMPGSFVRWWFICKPVGGGSIRVAKRAAAAGRASGEGISRWHLSDQEVERGANSSKNLDREDSAC